MALSAILVALALLWWAAWGIYSSVTYPYFPNFYSIMTLVVACFKALCGLLAIIGVLIKRGRMMHWMIFVIDVLVGICVISFIFQWISWGLALGGVTTPGNVPWQPSGEQIAYMVIDSIMNILTVIGGYYAIGLFQSLEKVLENGGTGWERRNYKELENDADFDERDNVAFNDDEKYTYEEDGKSGEEASSVDRSQEGQYSRDASQVTGSEMESVV